MPDTIAALAEIVRRAEWQNPRDAIAEAVRRFEPKYSTGELIAALQAEIDRLATDP